MFLEPYPFYEKNVLLHLHNLGSFLYAGKCNPNGASLDARTQQAMAATMAAVCKMRY